MTGDDVLALLASVGALITGDHLVYTSGRHGSSYVNKDALYPHTTATAAVCERIARHFAGAGVEVVAGPTIGGVILAQWTAYHLSVIEGREVLAVYAEEEAAAEGKRRVLRRGYDALARGRRALVVEDVLTTGGSARQVVEAVRAAGGEVIGVGALCNRGGVTAETVAVPELFALTEVPLESYAPEDCPLCAAGVLINTRVGKGAAYVGARPGGS
jgi:orotate phosphoribosyltransferase